jgi:hypothetical protein
MGGLAWAFDIRKERSRWGDEVPVPMDKYTSLLIAKLEKMVFEMKPVGEDRVQMIEKAWKDINGGETAEVGLPSEELVWFGFLHLQHFLRSFKPLNVTKTALGAYLDIVPGIYYYMELLVHYGGSCRA